MDVTAATPPGSAPGAPDAFRVTAEGPESGDTEFPGPGAGAMRFRGLGSAGLISPDLAPASFPAMIDALLNGSLRTRMLVFIGAMLLMTGLAVSFQTYFESQVQAGKALSQ